MSTLKKKNLASEKFAAISRLFGALSEPSRLTILHALHDGPLTVTELTEVCAMRQANVSKHLAVLYDHHLVKREREGILIRYEIADPMIFSLCDLVCGKMEKDTRAAAALFHPSI